MQNKIPSYRYAFPFLFVCFKLYNLFLFNNKFLHYHLIYLPFQLAEYQQSLKDLPQVHLSRLESRILELADQEKSFQKSPDQLKMLKQMIHSLTLEHITKLDTGLAPRTRKKLQQTQPKELKPE